MKNASLKYTSLKYTSLTYTYLQYLIADIRYLYKNGEETASHIFKGNDQIYLQNCTVMHSIIVAIAVLLGVSYFDSALNHHNSPSISSGRTADENREEEDLYTNSSAFMRRYVAGDCTP